jgi:hypothetical protein
MPARADALRKPKVVVVHLAYILKLQFNFFKAFIISGEEGRIVGKVPEEENDFPIRSACRHL